MLNSSWLRSSRRFCKGSFRGAVLRTLLAVLTAVRLSTFDAAAQTAEEFPRPGAEQDPDSETLSSDLETPQTADPDPVDTDSPDDISAVLDEPPPAPQRGHFGLSAGLGIESFYDSNVFIQPSHRHGDWINQIEPSIHLGLGDYLDRLESYVALDYTARETVFAVNRGQDSLNHDVQLAGLTQVSRLDLRFGLRFKTATETNIDAGNLGESQLYEAALNGRYELTGRTSVESDFLGRELSYTGLLSSKELRLTEWYVYRITRRLDESLGVTYGNLWVRQGPAQTYEQVLSRTRLLETATLTAGVSLGVEYRQYAGTAKSKVNPVLALDLDYDSHAGCVLHLEAFRKTESSTLYVDENRVETGLQANCRQHLARDWSAALAVEIGESDYTSTANTATSNRSDFVYSLTPSLIYKPDEHWSASIFLQCRRNESTQANFSFIDLQTGVIVKITF